jgi:hypothetical protein
MLKLIGILTGSALAVAFLIVALGVPDFSAPAPAQEDIAVADEAPPEAPVTDPVPDPLPDLVSGPLPDPAPVTDSEPEPVAMPDTEALIEQIFNPGPDSDVVVEENWYAFWSPFRSEIAARGLVAKLQETTGIDYRVVKIKTGVYEVAFAYVDDADIQDKLARISSATGLNMSDS